MSNTTAVAEHAESLALELHAGQAYYGTRDHFRRDFIDFHLRPGVQTIETLGGAADARATFWLHDAIEDTDMTLDGLAERGLPEGVIDGVDKLTWWPGQSYDEYLQRLAPLPQVNGLKIIDSKRNLQAALELKPHIDPEEYDIWVRQYAGNIVFLAPYFLESGRSRPWSQFVIGQADRAQAILDKQQRFGQAAIPLATGLPRPSFAS